MLTINAPRAPTTLPDYLRKEKLACRTCQGLLYYQQALPGCYGCYWREEGGRPLLRAWRSLKRDKVLPEVSIGG